VAITTAIPFADPDSAPWMISQRINSDHNEGSARHLPEA
jgi:hypothetical protein